MRRTPAKLITVHFNATRLAVFGWFARFAKSLPDVDIGMGDGVLTYFDARRSPGETNAIEIHALDFYWQPDLGAGVGAWERGGGIDQRGSSVRVFRLEITSGVEVGGEGNSIKGRISFPAEAVSNAEVEPIVEAARGVYQDIIRSIAARWPECGLTLSGETRKPPGRPAFRANERARELIAKGVPRAEVRNVWERLYRQERGDKAFNWLRDPDKSFNRAVAPVRATKAKK